MKTSTLHQIARQIHRCLGTIEPRTVNKMRSDIEWAAGDCNNKREAAYFLMIYVFDLIDGPDEDRRKIDTILAEFPGNWKPEQAIV
jgi:hypothetical protein